MSCTKDIQTNGVRSEEPNTSGKLQNADDYANLNNDTPNNKGAIPKIKIAKSKSNTFSKKNLKLNNNIEEEAKKRITNDLLKFNRFLKGTSMYIEQHKSNTTFVNYDMCLLESSGIFSNAQFEDTKLNVLDTNTENLVKHAHSNSSSEEDLLTLSDDGCIYTYKGDQVADLPRTFFNLNTSLLLPHDVDREQSLSPEMDFLEMDFDPGPSEESSQFEGKEYSTEIEKVYNKKEAPSDFLRTHKEYKVSFNLNDICCLQPCHIVSSAMLKSKCESLESSNNPSKNNCIEQANCFLPINKIATDDDIPFHKRRPWLCPLSERTTCRTEKLNTKRCHFLKGELLSPSEKNPLTSKVCDSILLSKVEDVMIWSEEEANAIQINQIGPSACGATAVLNVLNALQFPIPSFEELRSCVNTNLRCNVSPLTEYLLSRSNAGTDHNSLIEGLRKLSSDQIDGRFFHMHPERVVNLYTWLTFWIKNGAVPIATLNLQKCMGNIPDAWHHQMICGVGSKGIYLTNPLECLQAEHLWPQLCSESVLLIRREDILKRWNIKTDLPQLMKIQEKRWRTMNVVGKYEIKQQKLCSNNYFCFRSSG